MAISSLFKQFNLSTITRSSNRLCNLIDLLFHSVSNAVKLASAFAYLLFKQNKFSFFAIKVFQGHMSHCHIALRSISRLSS